MDKTGSPLHPPSSGESAIDSGVRPRALDLFCGAGGATKGLQRAGFHVTGVDNRPQPRYCGDAFHQADALTFPLEGFDFIWASPPCQAFTSLRFMPTAKAHPNLIPQTRARLIATSRRVGRDPEARDAGRDRADTRAGTVSALKPRAERALLSARDGQWK